MQRVDKFPEALRKFAKDVGAPKILVTDPHKIQKSKEVKDFATKLGQLCACLNRTLSGQIALSYMLGCLKRQFKRI